MTRVGIAALWPSSLRALSGRHKLSADAAIRVVALWGSQQQQIFFVQNGQTANVVYREVLSC